MKTQKSTKVQMTISEQFWSSKHLLRLKNSTWKWEELEENLLTYAIHFFSACLKNIKDGHEDKTWNGITE